MGFTRGPEGGVGADQGPDAFEYDKADLKWAERDVSKDRGADGVKNVVRRLARIHPAELMADVSEENQNRSGEGCDLPRQ